MATKINGKVTEDGFGSEIDFNIETVANEITRQYTLAAEQIAEKRYGTGAEVEIDFIPTGDSEFTIETDNATDENEFDGYDFGAAVYQQFCKIAAEEFENKK